MLRHERMSRVSVAGSRRVREEVIETVHDLHLLHLSGYDGSWEGFEPGDPIEGADDSSQQLVTIRSLQSILEVDSEDAGPARIVDPEESERELEDVRTRVNDLDGRRDDLEDDRQEDLENDLQGIDERLETMETLTSLGIDLDLLGGYETIDTRVGEGDADERLLEGITGLGVGRRSGEGGDDAIVLAGKHLVGRDVLAVFECL